MGGKGFVQIFAGRTFLGEHQDGIFQQFCKFGLDRVYGKIIRVGNKDILIFFSDTGLKMTAKSGVGIIAYDQIRLTFFQKFYTAD